MQVLTHLPPMILLRIFTYIPPSHLPSVQLTSKYFHLLLNIPHPYPLPIIDNAGLPSLIWASKIGHEDLVLFLLDHGVPINYLDSKYKTALHRASKYGHLNIVKLLLQRGAAPVIWDSSTGLTAMHYAAMTGQIEILRMLVDAGAWLEAVDKHGWTPLHWAVDGKYSIERLMLLQYGVSSVYKLDKDTRVRFREAVESRVVETCRFLLGCGADVTSCHDYGGTPLHRAVARSGSGVVRALLEGGAGVTVDWGDALGLCPFVMANRRPGLGLKELMLEARPGVDMVIEGGQINPHLEARRAVSGEGLFCVDGNGDEGGLVGSEVVKDMQEVEDGKIRSHLGVVGTLEMQPFGTDGNEENLILPQEEDCLDAGAREATREGIVDAQNTKGDNIDSATDLNGHVQVIENLPLGPETTMCAKQFGIDSELEPTKDDFGVTMPIQAGLA